MITGNRLGPPRHLPDGKEVLRRLPQFLRPNKKKYMWNTDMDRLEFTPYSTPCKIRETPEIDAKMHLPGRVNRAKRFGVCTRRGCPLTTAACRTAAVSRQVSWCYRSRAVLKEISRTYTRITLTRRQKFAVHCQSPRSRRRQR